MNNTNANNGICSHSRQIASPRYRSTLSPSARAGYCPAPQGFRQAERREFPYRQLPPKNPQQSISLGGTTTGNFHERRRQLPTTTTGNSIIDFDVVAGCLNNTKTKKQLINFHRITREALSPFPPLSKGGRRKINRKTRGHKAAQDKEK